VHHLDTSGAQGVQNVVPTYTPQVQPHLAVNGIPLHQLGDNSQSKEKFEVLKERLKVIE